MVFNEYGVLCFVLMLQLYNVYPLSADDLGYDLMRE